MFAILIGSRFLKTKCFGNLTDKLYDYSLSETPKNYKTLSEAKRDIVLFDDFLQNRISKLGTFIAEEKKSLESNKRRIPKLEANLAELMAQPYKEVFKKVRQVEKARMKAIAEVSSSPISTWTRELTRITLLKAQIPTVVKLQQIVSKIDA